MGVEQRRAAIVAAALPLLIEHGANVKTTEIAAAAGIAEGTVFRAFRDKKALYLACLEATFESEDEVARIDAIDRALPLTDRLIAAVEAITDYQNRMWSVLLALRAAGVDPREAEPHAGKGKDSAEFGTPPKAMVRIVEALAAQFDQTDENQTDENQAGETVRTSPQLAARLLLGLVFSNRMQHQGFGAQAAELPELVDLFLHGAVHPATGGLVNEQ